MKSAGCSRLGKILSFRGTFGLLMSVNIHDAVDAVDVQFLLHFSSCTRANYSLFNSIQFKWFYFELTFRGWILIWLIKVNKPTTLKKVFILICPGLGLNSDLWSRKLVCDQLSHPCWFFYELWKKYVEPAVNQYCSCYLSLFFFFFKRWPS